MAESQSIGGFMTTSEILKKLNESICKCSATENEKNEMLSNMKELIVSLIRKENNECL